ncbi:MAG: hypothetical protein MUE50_14255 [Pirellulaceae bacterium]|nr:hypothetical protein [Pirellulaceae bacterium]
MTRAMCFLWGSVTVALSLLAAPHVESAERVDLELITEPGLPVNGAQRWLASLKDVPFSSVRIRSANPGDQVEVRQRGGAGSRSYQVIGLLTERNTLTLPGGEFRMGDTAGLRAWLAKIREGGETRLQETEGPFGLTPTQLVKVHDALRVPVAFSTQGQPSFDVLKRIAGGLSLSFLADAEARQKMAGPETVADELQGLSAGTALVAALRPLGLVMAPQKQADGALKLWITDVRRAAESWPVGWPSQKSPRETAPQLLEFLTVEIENTPLANALNAIRTRLDLPLLFDHNSLARHQIDPARVNVSLPAGRTYYQGALDRLLNQAQLKSELRVDEAEKPFLWISTLKK